MDFVALELIKNLPLNENQEYFVFVNAKDSEIYKPAFAHVNIINKSLPYPIWEQFWLPRAAKKINLDVLHCTANTFPVNNAVPKLLTLHDIIFMERNPLIISDYSWYQRLGNYYRRILIKYYLDKVNKIVTVSEFELNAMKKGLKTEGLENKISRIYNGVGEHFNADELSQDQQENLIKKYDIPNDFALFLGNTDPKKNTPNTLKAFVKFAEKNKSAYLVIGDIDQSYVEKCLPASTPMDVKKRIVSVGYIDNQDLPGLLKLARIFLYTSLRESFGIPLVEGMRCGTPVITSNTSSMPEIAQGAALLVDPFSVEDIANSSDRLWNDKMLRAEFKEKGIARSTHFNWSRMSIQYSRIYSQVA